MSSNSAKRPKGSTRIARTLWGAVQEIACEMRQWQFPSEFRIAKPAQWAQVDDVTKVQTRTEFAEGRKRLERPISEIAVCLWDIERKLKKAGAVNENRKLRLLKRRTENAIAALEEVGVSIDDPIGRRYVEGSEGSLKPHFQPTPGTTREEILETIRPIVYWDDQLIGQGEVFVAVPAEEGKGGGRVPS